MNCLNSIFPIYFLSILRIFQKILLELLLFLDLNHKNAVKLDHVRCETQREHLKS